MGEKLYKGRGRKDPKLQRMLHTLSTKERAPKRQDRLCFSRDGIFCGDGLFRWWKEFDDSGYGWDGFFDIIDRAQLKCRIEAAQSLGIPVYAKTDYGNVSEHEMYDLFGTVVGDEELIK